MQVDDVQVIERVLALYGHLLDAQAWERLEEVFTEDASFDATTLGLPMLGTRREIEEGFAGMGHPVAHLTSNVVVDGVEGDGTARVRSKFLCPLRGGKVLTGEYHDVLVRAPQGWRIHERRVIVLRPKENTL